ncbi:MAG TPA: hypothetical protein VFC39_12485 [Acidobacteriaceae bacterium]|nr:hypothetical protein [Acidobacteriaceae bacterium]
MPTAELSPNVLSKLRILQDKLGAEDLDAALDKSLNIANYVADTISDPTKKLLVEREGKYTELNGIA